MVLMQPTDLRPGGSLWPMLAHGAHAGKHLVPLSQSTRAEYLNMLFPDSLERDVNSEEGDGVYHVVLSRDNVVHGTSAASAADYLHRLAAKHCHLVHGVLVLHYV